MPDQDPPKLIIDTDWKSQAQAEKEKLSAASKNPPAPSGAGVPKSGASTGAPAPGVPATDADADMDPAGPPREVTFKDVVSVMISQALAYMGAYPDPRTGQAVVALDLAKLHIDMLGVLETKTKGNLTEEESRLLSRALNELRLEYVDVAKMVAQAIQEGKATSIGPGGGGGVVPAASMPPAGSPKLNFGDLRNPR